MEAVALGRLEALRKQIRTLQASPRTYLATLRTGIPAIDGLMPAGGFPLGKVVELSGEAAAGRTTLALQAIATATREKHLAAYVDGPGELYPPFAAGVGVDLDRLLMVRPKAPRRLVWTALQLARCGAFTCVALDLTHTGVQISLPECKKLSDAAFKGGACILVLSPKAGVGAGRLRLEVCATAPRVLGLEVVRSGSGAGRKVSLPLSSLYSRGGLRIGPKGVSLPLPKTGESEIRDQSTAPFKRVKLHFLRDGRGIDGTRPGRDIALPALAGSLGL